MGRWRGMLAHAGQRSTGDLVCGLADVPIYYIDSILRLTKAEAAAKTGLFQFCGASALSAGQLLLYKINFRHLRTKLACLGMGVKENIHMSALYAAADILCRVNGSVNHQFASDGDNPGIHSHRMPGQRRLLRNWYGVPIPRNRNGRGSRRSDGRCREGGPSFRLWSAGRVPFV